MPIILIIPAGDVVPDLPQRAEFQSKRPPVIAIVKTAPFIPNLTLEHSSSSSKPSNWPRSERIAGNKPETGQCRQPNTCQNDDSSRLPRRKAEPVQQNGVSSLPITRLHSPHRMQNLVHQRQASLRWRMKYHD